MSLINKNLSFLHDIYYRQKDIKGVCLEGGSRAGKTYAIIDFLIMICSRQQGLVINIIRETYTSFKTTLYLDFAKRLSDYAIHNPFGSTKDISSYNLMGNKLNFIGADKPSKLEGAGSDIFWINEMLDTDKVIFDQSEQRCRRFFIGDWNPKTTDHWAFMLENRDDVKFLRTTLFDNPYLSKMEKQKILSYDPSNPINQKSGTADAFRWSVYGLGERAVCEGLVHPNVTWINEFPKHETLEIIGYGCDFGYTNSPTVIIKAGNIGRDLYVECLFYAPTPTINELLPVMRKYINANNYVTCDSADPIMISDLRRNGVNALGIKKVGDKEGFIKYGVDLVNRFNLHIVRNASVRKEQENRVWEMVGGVSLNRPKQGNDHFWDALTYCLVTDFRNVLERE